MLSWAAVAYTHSSAAKKRLATVLLERLKAANSGHHGPMPLIAQQSASAQHTQLGAELVALSALVNGELKSWATARGSATMGTATLDADDLLATVAAAVARPAETGAALLLPETQWPEWMERRVSLF